MSARPPKCSFLSRQEVEALLNLDMLVELLGPAMAELSAGSVSMPPRGVTEVHKGRGLLAVMPVFLNSSQTLSTKLVSVFPENEAQGLASHQAVILVFDALTGSPRALMDGTYIPGRTSAEQIILYKSVGVAVQDAVAARLVLDAAEHQRLDREVEI